MSAHWWKIYLSRPV